MNKNIRSYDYYIQMIYWVLHSKFKSESHFIPDIVAKPFSTISHIFTYDLWTVISYRDNLDFNMVPLEDFFKILVRLVKLGLTVCLLLFIMDAGENSFQRLFRPMTARWQVWWQAGGGAVIIREWAWKTFTIFSPSRPRSIQHMVLFVEHYHFELPQCVHQSNNHYEKVRNEWMSPSLPGYEENDADNVLNWFILGRF